jgi:hypothetical protein
MLQPRTEVTVDVLGSSVFASLSSIHVIVSNE